MPEEAYMTPGTATPGSVGGAPLFLAGPPAPHLSFSLPANSPRTPSPVWEMLGEPEEQGQAESQDLLPLYVTGAAAVTTAVENATLTETETDLPVALGSIVAAVVEDAGGGITASPETPGAVIKRKPPAAQTGAKKRRFATLSSPQDVVPLQLEALSACISPFGAVPGVAANAGAVSNAIAGCVESFPPRQSKRARQNPGTEIRFAMF